MSNNTASARKQVMPRRGSPLTACDMTRIYSKVYPIKVIRNFGVLVAHAV